MTDLNDDARDLLAAARDGDGPSPDDRARVQRALAVSVATGATATGATKAAAATKIGTTAGAASATTPLAAAGATKIATWLGVGLVAGLASAGAVIAVSHDTNGTKHPMRESTTARATLVATPPANLPRAVTPVLAPAEAPAKEPETTVAVETPTMPARSSSGEASDEKSRSASVPVPAHGTTRPAPSSLAAETAALEAVRGALGRGDARTALSLLEENERQFPGATLVEERLASKVFALCGLGRTAEARRVADAFLRAAPSSPLRARVLDSCAFGR
jgi:hypothetical protein